VTTLLLATIRAQGPQGRAELERLVALCGGRIVAFATNMFTVEVTGTEAEIDQFLEMARPLGVRNMVRSAPIAISKPAEVEQNENAA
jgi:acetolactate synthase-1/3 small subunit